MAELLTSTVFRIEIPSFPSVRQVRSFSAPVCGSIPAAKQRYIPIAGIYPQEFSVSGTHVGIKASNSRDPDLALITSHIPCSAAAVFTQNKFQAAPVTVSKRVLKRREGHGIRSIIINSGCANAVTGEGGLEDATNMVAAVDRVQRSPTSDSSLVCSTGVIGQRLPIQKILNAVPKAISNLSNLHDAWCVCPKVNPLTF